MSTLTEKKLAANYRKVVVPTPEILPACKNCKHFGYDHDDRQNFKGELTFRKINLRCRMLTISVHSNCTCDGHEFHHPSKADR